MSEYYIYAAAHTDSMQARDSATVDAKCVSVSFPGIWNGITVSYPSLSGMAVRQTYSPSLQRQQITKTLA